MERFGSKAVLWRIDLAWPPLRRRACALLGDERGSATIEFVLWVPIFATILVAAIDATVLYLHHTEMWNVSRDVARRVAVGDITEAQAPDVVDEELYLYSDAYFVETSDPTDTDVSIMIQTHVAEASIFGFFKPILDEYLTAMVIMRREPI